MTATSPAHYSRFISLIVLAMGLGAALIILLAAPAEWTWSSGLATGTLIGIALFRLRISTILNAMNNPSDAASFAVVKLHYLTYGLMIGAVVAAYFLRDYLHPWGVLIGMVLPNACLMLDGMLRPGTSTEATDPVQQEAAREA